MVAPTDLKTYRGNSSGLVGTINTSDLIVTASHNNIFPNTPAAEAITGKDYFQAVFFKNTHASEDMVDLTFWETSDSPNPESTYKWGFDPANYQQGYRWDPNFTSTGANLDSTASDPTLQLTRFSLFAWVKLNNGGDHTTEGFIANKGGLGSETAGQNMNYGLYVRTDEKIEGGFEEGAGTDHFITSPVVNNDGIWHAVLLTFGTSGDLKLYIDDPVTPVASTNVGVAVPESSGTNPFVIGRNSRAADRFLLSGEQVDEVRVWNRELSSEDERVGLFESNIANPTGLVLEKKFGADTGTVVGQTIPNINTSPVGVDWQEAGSKPTEPNVGRLGFGKSFLVWVWKHVEAGADEEADDPFVWAFSFKIPAGGTGTPGSGGGGSGGSPPPSSDYKIAFAGDWGCEQATDEVLALINSQGYDFVWGVGDNTYASSATCWTSRFQTLFNSGKFDSGYGNHEYSESAGVGPYKTFLHHNLTYFTKQFQNIFFLVIDSNINCDPGSAQHNFITSELNRVKNDSTIVWKIAIWHHPSVGIPSDHAYNEAETVEAFWDLLIANKVSLIVSGHIHNWQRSKLVTRNPSSPTSPTVVQSAAPYSRNSGGLVQIVTGGGGHDGPHGDGALYSLGSTPSFMAFGQRLYDGVWEIVASNNGNTLTCQFRNTDAEVFDTFVFTA